MSSIEQLLNNNQAWADSIKRENPEFFSQLANAQQPKYLWIGCSDSRVPATQLLGLVPGEIFVHRNIANQVIETDLNCLSVIQFAVEVLKVEHVIVCGHYGCGGVEASMGNDTLGLIDGWLDNIRAVQQRHHSELDALETKDEKFNRLCELNVIAQVNKIAKLEALVNAWQNNSKITIHGLIYNLKTGLLKDLNISRCE